MTGQGRAVQGRAMQGRAKSYVYGLSRPIAPDTALDSFSDDFWAFISAAAAAGTVVWSLVKGNATLPLLLPSLLPSLLLPS